MASASSSQRRVAETALNGMQWGRTKALGELDTTAKLNALYIKTIRQLIALGDYQAASIYQESLHKNLLLSADWCKLYKMTGTPNLLQWQVYKYVKDNML